jgi:phage shock protein A
MSVLGKLNTLFRANARSAAEVVIDANAIRIYEQEIIDAEQLLARRRDAMATMIANRNELERELDTVKATIARREEQLQRLSAEERTDELLDLAAEEIAAAENQQHQLEIQHADLSLRIRELEITLRQLICEIKQHRRDLKLMASQSRSMAGANDAGINTLNGRLQALRATRAGINGQLADSRDLEAGVKEVAQRLDEDPLEREIQRAGVGDDAVHIAAVKERLRKSLAG